MGQFAIIVKCKRSAIVIRLLVIMMQRFISKPSNYIFPFLWKISIVIMPENEDNRDLNLIFFLNFKETSNYLVRLRKNDDTKMIKERIGMWALQMVLLLTLALIVVIVS